MDNGLYGVTFFAIMATLLLSFYLLKGDENSIAIYNKTPQVMENSTITKVSILTCYYSGGKGKSKYAVDTDDTKDVSIKTGETQAFTVDKNHKLYKISVSVNGKVYTTPVKCLTWGIKKAVIFDGNTLHWDESSENILFIVGMIGCAILVIVGGFIGIKVLAS